MKIKKFTELSLLTAAALIVFVIELRFPDVIPIPGVKLGLANIFTVYAIYHFKPAETAMLVFVRVFLGSLFGGNISSVIYSFSGAFMCLLGMILISKIIPAKYIWLCSIFGAVFHNFGQICAAIFVTGSFTVLFYLPILLVSGCIAGFFTGISAQMILKHTEKSKSNYNKKPEKH